MIKQGCQVMNSSKQEQVVHSVKALVVLKVSLALKVSTINLEVALEDPDNKEDKAHSEIYSKSLLNSLVAVVLDNKQEVLEGHKVKLKDKTL